MSAAAAITTCFQDYPRNPMQQAAKLRSLMEADPSDFLDCVGQDTNGDLGNRGFRFALLLLRNSGLLIPFLADPRRSSLGQALRLMKFMVLIEGDFADVLLRMVESNDSSLESEEHKLRLLDLILDSGSHLSGWRLVAKLLSSDDYRIKARCVNLMTRNRLDPKMIDSIYDQGDARTRADLVEVLSGNRHPQLETVIRRALLDGNNRVAANAYLAAYQADDERSLAWLSAMIGDDKTNEFRISAAWAMGQTRDVRFSEALIEARRSSDPRLRATALKSLTKLERIERCGHDPGLRIDRVFETPGLSDRDDDIQRTLYLTVTGPDLPADSSPKAVDFFLFREKIPVLKYAVEKPIPSRQQVRIACPAAALPGLIRCLAEDRDGAPRTDAFRSTAIQTIAVYGDGVAEQKSTTDQPSTLRCLWVGSLDEAAKTLLLPWAGDVDRQVLLIVDPKFPKELDLRQFEEDCRRVASTPHIVEFDGGGPTSGAPHRRFEASGGNEFWESYMTVIERGWRVRLRGPLNQLSLRIRSRVGTEIRFSEKVVWP